MLNIHHQTLINRFNLGHIRNNVLGYSICKIYESAGYEVIKNNLVNDRGIHICKSMYAYLRFGNHETPESSGVKGDHLVGKYYVEFDKNYQKEVQELVDKGMDSDEAKENAPSMVATREMLKKWENGDPETLSIWESNECMGI